MILSYYCICDIVAHCRVVQQQMLTAALAIHKCSLCSPWSTTSEQRERSESSRLVNRHHIQHQMLAALAIQPWD